MGSLLVLGAIWGASFLFIRMLVPEIGSYWSTTLRLGIGAIGLIAVVAWRRESLNLFKLWRHYLITGMLGMGIPFMCYSWAAQVLPSGYMAVLNATVPYWVSLIGIVFFREKLGVIKLLGLLLGIAGVVFLVQLSHLPLSAAVVLAVVLCLMATCFYAINAIYIKKYAPKVSPHANSAGALTMSTLVLLLFFPFADGSLQWSLNVVFAAGMLGVVCSSIAFLIFFKMIETTGAMTATLVTFVIPAFAFIWGVLFLGEAITLLTVVGTLCVLLGVALVLYGENWWRWTRQKMMGKSDLPR